MEKTCEYCGKSYTKNKNAGEKQWRKRKYCSHPCSVNAKRKIQYGTTCEVCGKKLKPYRFRTCSLSCAAKLNPRIRKDINEEELIKLFSVSTMRDLAQKYQCDRSAIKRILKKHNIKPHTLRKSKLIKPTNFWQDKKRPALSEKTKKKMSEARLEWMRNNDWGRYKTGNFPHIKSGKREDIGIYVRSGWEANYCRYLKWLKERGEIYKWEYESDTFEFTKIKKGTQFYTPDFKIWEKADSEPYYVEVKGWMDSKSKTKLKRMAKYYPKIKILIVMRAEYRAIAKWSHLIPGWE